MLSKLREAPGFLWRTLFRFFGDGCPGMAAALSFYTFFSLPALLALLLALVPQPRAFDHDAQGQTLEEDRPDDGQRRDRQDQVALGEGLPVP
jgi:uncharacterized BrkB/YihY/UPF0761 family membrane protein